MLTKDVSGLNRRLLLRQHQQRAPISRSQECDYPLYPLRATLLMFSFM